MAPNTFSKLLNMGVILVKGLIATLPDWGPVQPHWQSHIPEAQAELQVEEQGGVQLHRFKE